MNRTDIIFWLLFVSMVHSNNAEGRFIQAYLPQAERRNSLLYDFGP